MTFSLVRDAADLEVGDAKRFGGKASGLSRMAAAGVPVPPAFVIGAEGFRHFRDSGDKVGEAMMGEVRAALAKLESATGRQFGGVERPLLVSVRSGAAVSMPGMMDTVLNLGLTSASAYELAETKGARFALDTWLRFWRMFFDTVLGLDPADLADAVAKSESAARAAPSRETFAALEAAILGHAADQGEELDLSPWQLLESSIAAVFRSWDSARAKAYRKHHGISDELGTAVTIQAMVFGNADENSGSGVAFSRNPNDGARTLYGEYLVGRQGEDLVAGTHSPIDLADPHALEAALRARLIEISARLEALYRDAVDMEFTVESGQLYLLQVRPAKRTAAAAVRIAIDLAEEGLISPREATARVAPDQLRKLSRPAFDETELAAAQLLVQGLGSSPGNAYGVAILDSDRAAEAAGRGEQVLLLRPITSPKDIRGMLAANGIVTATGGALSHAAVVSRALDKPCIVGCETVVIDEARRTFSINGEAFREGDEISIDGATGRIYAGQIAFRTGAAARATLDRLLALADGESRCEVWASPRGLGEAHEPASAAAPGLAVTRLTDLLMSQGAIGPFVDAISKLDQPNERLRDDIAAIVRDACTPFLAENAGRPVHMRLPRISSDRARRLIENWTEMPPELFLPLGSRPYLQAALRGLSEAAKASKHGRLTALLGGVTDSRETVRFVELCAEADLEAGAIVQNAAALIHAGEIAQACRTVWIDPVEIIRTVYGFPTEVLQADHTLEDYATEGFLAANPFARPAVFLCDRFRAASEVAKSNAAAFAIDLSGGFSAVLAGDLFAYGFRRFATSPSRRDELRLILAQSVKE
jgi:pyruvate,orthophosphate dikinase